MSLESPVVLILEDNVFAAQQLGRAIQQRIPQCQIVEANSVNQAQLLLADIQFDFFLLDVHLPDGNGIDFFADVLTLRPDAKAIILTAEPLPEYRRQADSLGALRFLEKPVHLATVAEEVALQLGAGDGGAGTDYFEGALSHLTPIDIVQLKCLGCATQVIEFSVASGKSGRIHFQKGQIVHAQAGDLKGPEALALIVSWKGGKFKEVEEEPTSETTLFSDWQTLLMNAVQAADESAAEAKPPPTSREQEIKQPTRSSTASTPSRPRVAPPVPAPQPHPTAAPAVIAPAPEPLSAPPPTPPGLLPDAEDEAPVPVTPTRLPPAFFPTGPAPRPNVNLTERLGAVISPDPAPPNRTAKPGTLPPPPPPFEPPQAPGQMALPFEVVVTAKDGAVLASESCVNPELRADLVSVINLKWKQAYKSLGWGECRRVVFWGPSVCGLVKILPYHSVVVIEENTVRQWPVIEGEALRVARELIAASSKRPPTTR